MTDIRMDSVSKNKWQIRSAALIIFLLGFVAGGLALNFYHVRHPANPQAARRGLYEQMLDRLNLTAEQKPQVEKIFSDTREKLTALRQESMPKVNEIRAQADERLRQVLTPEQWRQFEQIKGEMKSHRPPGEEGKGGR
ncbi:MAG TPA: hypothetical protein VFD58_17030 [Blastocatellia bacterium]|nr:hypothetical protein [Blastocatellia bacterium]